MRLQLVGNLGIWQFTGHIRVSHWGPFFWCVHGLKGGLWQLERGDRHVTKAPAGDEGCCCGVSLAGEVLHEGPAVGQCKGDMFNHLCSKVIGGDSDNGTE